MNIAVAEGCHYHDTVRAWLYVLSCIISFYWSCEVVLILRDFKRVFFSISMSDFREALWRNNADLNEALQKYVGRLHFTFNRSFSFVLQSRSILPLVLIYFVFYFLLNLWKIVKFWVAALGHHTPYISEQALNVSLVGRRCNFWRLLHCNDHRSPWWASQWQRA